jgi:hypothetical protein
MPMPDRVIKRVNAIGQREGQGRAFRFLNPRGEPYEWTSEVPKDDPEFQGLLDEREETAVYPDISAKLPGVELEEEERDYRTVMDDEPDFRHQADAALQNAGIDAAEMIRRAQGDEHKRQGPALVEADEDEIVYEITFDPPDAGLAPPDPDIMLPLGDNRDDTTEPAAIPQDVGEGRRYPQRARRSVIGNQPYDNYAPRTTILQLGTVRTHRSVFEANQLARMTKYERMMATTTCTPKDFIDDAVHEIDAAMSTLSEAELSVWAYIMVQYNLKPGLRKFGNKGERLR